MRQARGVHPVHRAADLDADAQVAPPVAQLARVEELGTIIGRGEPLALLLLPLDAEEIVVLRPELEEELRLVSRRDDAQLVARDDDLRGPAEQVLPVVAARLLEDLLAIAADDHLQPIPRRGVLRVAKERDDDSRLDPCE